MFKLNFIDMNRSWQYLLFFLLISFSLQSQEKIKGSRNVVNEERSLEDFHSVEIEGEFEATIRKGPRSSVEVEADDNLHSIIETEVVDGILHIRPLQEIRRSRSLELLIELPGEFRQAIIKDKVVLETDGEISAEDFELVTRDNSRAYITITADTMRLVNDDKSKIELNLTAKNAYFQLNGDSDLKALVNSPVFKVDLYEKASARIEGDIEEFQLRSEHSSKFEGRNLTAKKAEVLAEGRSDLQVNVVDTLRFSGRDHSRTGIYNSPEIEVIEFAGEAVMEKKEF